MPSLKYFRLSKNWEKALSNNFVDSWYIWYVKYLRRLTEKSKIASLSHNNGNTLWWRNCCNFCEPGTSWFAKCFPRLRNSSFCNGSSSKKHSEQQFNYAVPSAGQMNNSEISGLRGLAWLIRFFLKKKHLMATWMRKKNSSATHVFEHLVSSWWCCCVGWGWGTGGSPETFRMKNIVEASKPSGKALRVFSILPLPVWFLLLDFGWRWVLSAFCSCCPVCHLLPCLPH